MLLALILLTEHRHTRASKKKAPGAVRNCASFRLIKNISEVGILVGTHHYRPYLKLRLCVQCRGSYTILSSNIFQSIHKCPLLVVSFCWDLYSVHFSHLSRKSVSCNLKSWVSFSITNISSTMLSHCSRVGGSALYHNLVIAFLLAANNTLTRYLLSVYC